MYSLGQNAGKTGKSFSPVLFLVKIVLCAGFLCTPFSLWGKIRFSGLDLCEDNRLLLKAASTGGGARTQNALFLANLADRSLFQISVFPERMEIIEGGQYILVHSAFGSFRLSLSGGLPLPFPGFPSFASGSSPGGRVEHTLASPDGKFLLYVEPESYARGALVLLDETGRKTVISRDVEKPGRFFPALWSHDSGNFLYTKGGRLFFYTAASRSSPPEERWRLIGEGGINSVVWAGPGSAGPADTGRGNFYYLRGSTVYRIRGDELSVRALYSGFLEQGTAAGKIPFTFDPGFDRFWVAPDGRSLILCKNGRDLFYYPLGIDEDTETNFASLPYVVAPRSGARSTVLWPPSGTATVLITPPSGSAIAYRIDTKNTARSTARSFESLDIPPADNALLSPDGNSVLFWGKGGLWLYNYQNWKAAAVLSSSPVYSALWLGNNELVIGGEDRIERFRLSGDGSVRGIERKLLCLASVSNYGFEETAVPSGITPPGAVQGTMSRRIFAMSGNAWYATDGISPWIEYRAPAVREASQASSRYRVYLTDFPGSFFENIPMVRNTASVGTFPLVEPKTAVIPDGRPPALERNLVRLPDTEADYVFNHGRRESRELALVFDVYDDTSGVSIVLDALKRFGIRATFFLNGECIRRNPQSVRDIAEAGHECSSMFYAPLDLSDVRYRIDRTFIERGLARNEDDFYRASGKELSLLWHPPYYALSREIAEAAAAAGYRTTGRDIDSRDWIPASGALRLGMEQPAAADIIDSVMDAAEGGSIIPIRLGLLEGGRPDYLFNSMEVLLDALFRQGYEVVPVSTLLSKSR